MINLNIKLDIEEFLQESFNRELEKVIESYKQIDTQTKEKLDTIYTMISKTGNEDYKPSLEEAIELTKEPLKVVEMNLWLRKNLDILSISEAREILNDLENQGYVNLHDEYILAYKDTDLYKLNKEILMPLLDDRYHVEDFFTKERLVEMWLEETTKEEALSELLEMQDPLEELLEVIFEEAYEFSDEKKMMFALLEY